MSTRNEGKHLGMVEEGDVGIGLSLRCVLEAKIRARGWPGLVNVQRKSNGRESSTGCERVRESVE